MNSADHTVLRILISCLVSTTLLVGCRSQSPGVLDNAPSSAHSTAAEQMQFMRLLAVIGCQSIYIDRKAHIDASIASQWNVHIDRGVTIAGNVFNIEGPVLLDRDATVLGDIDAAGPVKLERGASYKGNIVDQSVSVPIADIALPVLPDSTTGTDITVDNGAIADIAPGVYGKLTLKRGGEVRLSSGAYRFEAIGIERDSTMSLDTNAGPILVNVNNGISIGRDVTISASRNGPDNVLLQVGQGDVKVDRNVRFAGTILAPRGTISIDRQSVFEGALYAAEVKLGRDVRVAGKPSPSLLDEAATGWLGYEACTQEQ